MKMKQKTTSAHQSAPPRLREQAGRPELPPALVKEHIQLKTNHGQKAASGIKRTHLCAAVSYTSEALSRSPTGVEEKGSKPA